MSTKPSLTSRCALPAALLAVKLQATLRALAPHFPNLGDLAAGVNVEIKLA